MTNITFLKEHYAIAREALSQMQEPLKKLDDLLNEKIEKLRQEHRERNAEAYACFDEMSEKARTTEEALRTAMLETFTSTGNKAIDADLSIRINTALAYDGDEALGWAKEHGLCLALDKKAFEKLASVQALDFVQTVEKPVAVIAKVFKETSTAG